MLLPLLYIAKGPTNILLSTLETSLTQRHHSTRRRATKFILNDYQSSYRSRLLTLYLLPLMYLFELYDISFVIKSLKNPTSSFNIYNFIDFYSSSSRLSHANKLIHHKSFNSTTHHFFFNRVSRLWNVLPIIDFSLPTSMHSNQQT